MASNPSGTRSELSTEPSGEIHPDRTLLVSGVSRSGTSLLSVLLNGVDDLVCFNEVLPLEADQLPGAVARVRRDLLAGKPVRNKFDGAGQLTTDTLDGLVKKKAVVDKPLSPTFVVASKRNLPYLNQAERLLDDGYPLVVMVRDPVFTLGSWGSPKAAAAAIPGARIGPDDTHPHWHAVRFSRVDPVERRAEAWEHFARRIWALRSRLLWLRYEDLCADPRAAVTRICARIGLTPPKALPDVVRPVQNLEDRYPDLDRIRAAVDDLCPTRRDFGYG